MAKSARYGSWPSVMAGYLAPPPADAESIGRGWLRTGEAGTGRRRLLLHHDRLKDMIVSGARTCNRRGRDVIMSHAGRGDVAVIGVPHESGVRLPGPMVVRVPAPT